MALPVAREHGDRADHAEQPAVKRHAALPHRKDLEQIRRVVLGLVEQHIAETAADHDAEHAVEQQVLDIAARPAALGEMRLAGSQRREPQEEAERDEVGQAVPVDRNGPELEGDGVELRVDKHAPAAP